MELPVSIVGEPVAVNPGKRIVAVKSAEGAEAKGEVELAERDTKEIELALPAGIDPERSRLSLNLGTSPLATIRGMQQSLHVYPYYCTEQVVSTATPIIAIYRAQRQSGVATVEAPRREIARAVDLLARRQRTDGAIGYWSPDDWSSVWLRKSRQRRRESSA